MSLVLSDPQGLHSLHSSSNFIVRQQCGVVEPLGSQPIINFDLLGAVELVDESSMRTIEKVIHSHNLYHSNPSGVMVLKLQIQKKFRLLRVPNIDINYHTKPATQLL
jgi:hypothetical protein